MTQEERKKALDAACKDAAAANKSEPVRQTAVLTDSEVQKALTAHPFVETHSTHLGNLLVLMWYTFVQTSDRSYLKAMLDQLAQASPGLRYGPSTPSVGTDAFLDFDNELSIDKARAVVNELKNAAPGMEDLDANIVQRIHGVLRSSPTLHDELPPRSLGFFLEWCHFKVTSTEFTDEVIQDLIKEALLYTKIHGRHIEPAPPSVAAFKAWIASDRKTAAANFHLLLSMMRNFIKCMDNHSGDAARAIIQQHGAMLTHSSLKDVMVKLGNAVDTATVKSLMEQIGILHAATFAAKHRDMVNIIQGADKYLERLSIHNEADLEQD